MPITVDGHHLKVEDVVKVARRNEPIELHADAKKRIDKCRALLEDKIEKREIMYGVNTGIGELSEVVLTQEQVEQYQRYIIYSHAAGYGTPLPLDTVRAAMLSRISCHCHGHSGLRLAVTETMKEMLNRGRLREGLGRRLRRPVAHVAGGPGGHGRRGGVLQGRAAARGRGHEAG